MHRRLETRNVTCHETISKQSFLSFTHIEISSLLPLSHSLFSSLHHHRSLSFIVTRSCSLSLSLLVCVWKQTSKPNYVFNFAKQQEMSGPDPDIDTRALPTSQNEDGHKLQQRL